MIIIYGTMFLTEKRLRQRTDKCQFCGQVRTISSFEGFKVFHIYGVPLIPLGKKKVLNKCKGCKRYLQLSISKWNELRTKELARAQETYAADRNDPQKALFLFDSFETFGTDQESADFLKEMTSKFPSDADVLARAAGWYLTQNQPDLALQFAEKSIAQEPKNDAVRRMLAALYTKKGDLSTALNHYLAVTTPRDDHDMMAMLHLAMSLRKAGRVRDAYGLVQKLAAIYPEQAAKHYSVRSETALLEKNLNVVSSALPPAPGHKKEALIAAAVIAGLALLLGLGNYYAKGHQTLYITNELGLPVKIKVDQFAPMEINSGDFKSVNIAEGKHNVETMVGAKKMSPRTMDVENSFFERLFESRIFVWNVAGAAVIVREEVLYTTNEKERQKENEYQIYTGHDLVVFRGITYPFTTPPKTVRLEKNQTSTTFSRISTLKLDPYQTVRVALDHEKMVPPADVMSHMEGRMEAGMMDQMYLSIYRAVAQKNNLSARADQFLAQTH